MNIVDIIIMGIVFLSAFVGFWRGITREILGILSWVVAAFLTYFFHALPEPLVGTVISNDFLKEILSALIVFVVTLILFTAVTYSFSDVVKSSVAGGADKVLGFLFGTFRGIFLVAILTFGVSKFLLKNSEHAPSVLKESKLIPVAEKVMTHLIQSIPSTQLSNWKDKAENFFNDWSVKGIERASEMVDGLPENKETNNAQ